MSAATNPAMRPRPIALLIGALGATALLAAALPELTAPREAVVAAAPSTATVKIDNFAFAPATLRVTAGTTVTWKNDDAEATAQWQDAVAPHDAWRVLALNACSMELP
jgi:plastocyanin